MFDDRPPLGSNPPESKSPDEATGPYRLIRHPGYLGGAAISLCGAIALGSWWAWFPAAGLAVVFVRRTFLEDRYLRRELPGYQDYTRKVRYRLLPGIWCAAIVCLLTGSAAAQAAVP